MAVSAWQRAATIVALTLCALRAGTVQQVVSRFDKTPPRLLKSCVQAAIKNEREDS